jgi:hypothetical protein
MSGTYTFTDAQKADVRRFVGYAALGGVNSGMQSYRFFTQYGFLEWKLQNLSNEEGAVVVNTYLTNLNTLEQAIIAAAGNLDTDSASVWHHNKNEVADRTALFDDWRRRLCAFLGIPPGPGLGQAASLAIVA